MERLGVSQPKAQRGGLKAGESEIPRRSQDESAPREARERNQGNGGFGKCTGGCERRLWRAHLEGAQPNCPRKALISPPSPLARPCFLVPQTAQTSTPPFPCLHLCRFFSSSDGGQLRGPSYISRCRRTGAPRGAPVPRVQRALSELVNRSESAPNTTPPGPSRASDGSIRTPIDRWIDGSIDRTAQSRFVARAVSSPRPLTHKSPHPHIPSAPPSPSPLPGRRVQKKSAPERPSAGHGLRWLRAMCEEKSTR